jgi:hypothetical protein
MALNKLKFNSLNVTPTAGKIVGFNSSANGLEATLSGGAMTFIKKLTASSSSTLSFVNGASDVVLDSTYKEYIFIFNNLHYSNDACNFQVNFRDGSTAYDATKTTTFFRAQHDEADSTTDLSYQTGRDTAQGTGSQVLAENIGIGNDESLSGTLHLFNPASTTFVKHFIAQTQYYQTNDYSETVFVAGYCNVTAAIDGVQFDASAGTIDAGTITLYGIN